MAASSGSGSGSGEAWLAARAAGIDRDGLRRIVRPRQADSSSLDLAGNDYLGLARDPRVIAAGVSALQTWGAGSTGSRLVTGTTQLHADLEADLALALGSESALVFASGYTANLGVVTALGGPDVLVVSDAGNHASIIDAARLSRSRVVVAPHADLAAVEAALADRAESRAMVVTDAVFSADGDLAPVASLQALCHRYDAWLVVDEAHAIGVVGPGGLGLCVAAGLGAERNVIRTVTLSKALGSQGGAVLASAAVVDVLLNTARTFIFDTALAPASVGAAQRALQILIDEPSLADRVRANAGLLATSIGAPPPAAAVVSLVLGDAALSVAVADRCRSAGVLVGCFRPPSVPAGSSRLRLTARADLSEAELLRAAEVVVEAVKALS
jgi:8-amino-7-oxononanoate synthase